MRKVRLAKARQEEDEEGTESAVEMVHTQRSVEATAASCLIRQHHILDRVTFVEDQLINLETRLDQLIDVCLKSK